MLRAYRKRLALWPYDYLMHLIAKLLGSSWKALRSSTFGGYPCDLMIFLQKMLSLEKGTLLLLRVFVPLCFFIFAKGAGCEGYPSVLIFLVLFSKKKPLLPLDSALVAVLWLPAIRIFRSIRWIIWFWFVTDLWFAKTLSHPEWCFNTPISAK